MDNELDKLDKLDKLGSIINNDDIQDKCYNYLEINILNNNSIDNNSIDNNIGNEVDIIDLNWDNETFTKFLSKIINSKKFNKPFEKKFKVIRYFNQNYIINLSDNKYNHYKLFYVKNNYIKNNIKNISSIFYKKSTLPIFQFPSTDNIHDKFFLNKIIFKITNLIYLNFEIMKKNENDIFYRIYINFNNDKHNIDYDTIVKSINETIKNLLCL